MVLWIGVDDTDSLQGMCTTFLATEIVRDLTEDFDLIGYPRLVRLNPNIPWKTRGNGAVCMRFGEGVGRPFVVGSIAGRPIQAYSRGRTISEQAAVADRIAPLVERWSRFDDSTTNPAFAVLRGQPTPTLYWRAVRGVVSKRSAKASARGPGVVRPYRNGRGRPRAARRRHGPSAPASSPDGALGGRRVLASPRPRGRPRRCASRANRSHGVRTIETVPVRRP